MPLKLTPPRTWPETGNSTLRRVAATALLTSLFLSACGESTGPGNTDATLAGAVRAAGTATPLPGAKVSIGSLSATSDANGHFEIAGITAGSVTVRVTLAGYEDAQAQLQLAGGANSHDFSLAVREIYEAGGNAIFVPAGTGPIRAVIITLGGPDASGFVTGDRIVPTNRPDALEATMQALGASLRELARTQRVALFGSSTTGMASSTESDNLIFAALTGFATSSGRPELATAPFLPVGISAGSREAAGLVSRHPERSVGLFVRVPASVPELNGAALDVPAFVLQGAVDTDVDNAAVQQSFLVNRSRHGLWALAVEPGVGHQTPTGTGNAGQISWMREALIRRLPAAPGGELIALDEEQGWLGDNGTLDVSAWADFTAEKLEASWMMSQQSAQLWKNLGSAGGGGS